MNGSEDPVPQPMPASGFGNEQQVREVMDSLSPAVFVGLLTVDGILTYANRAALEAMGAKLEDVLGKPFDSTPWWSFSEISRKRLRDAIQAAAAGVASHFEFSFRNVRGQILTMDFTLNPVFGHRGQVAYLIPSAREVTQRKLAEHALCVTQFAVDHAYSAIFQLAADGRMLYVNNSCSRLLGYCRNDLLALHIFDIDLQLSAANWPARWKELKERNLLRYESVYRHAKGHEIPVDVSASYIEYEGEEYCFFYSLDITDRKAAERRIYCMTHYDPLTGLPNRTLLSEQLARMLAGADANRQTVAVMVIGLDRLKLVNEALGHAGADEVLRICAKRITDCACGVRMAARIGADKFAILIPSDSADAAAPLEVAKCVMDALAAPISVEGQEIFINCSIGLTAYPQDGDNAEELLKNASTALRRAERHGGNAIHVYSSSSESRNPGRLSMETALRGALKRNELAVHYQPQLNLSTGRICSVEALLRWRHPENGLISMARFIPIAEETGLILPMSEWVLQQACMQLGTWSRQGISVERMAVNLSARQFRQKDLTHRLEQILHDTGTDPGSLELELTESMLVDDIEAAMETMSSLKEIGIHMSLDDFGTGYSSLSYLKRFPIDKLKLDQSFVHEITTDPRSAAIADGIIALGRRLKLTVLAEGVETEEQLSMLHDSGCDMAQGYLFCRPLPAERLTALLCGPPSDFSLYRDQNSKTVM
ncbi:MAG: sensory box/GGDEF family protein [Herminiimonas sp.]|nr:sensory box/GGDEF family protein [Herminiimonas sp.]